MSCLRAGSGSSCRQTVVSRSVEIGNIIRKCLYVLLFYSGIILLSCIVLNIFENPRYPGGVQTELCIDLSPSGSPWYYLENPGKNFRSRFPSPTVQCPVIQAVTKFLEPYARFDYRIIVVAHLTRENFPGPLPPLSRRNFV